MTWWISFRRRWSGVCAVLLVLVLMLAPLPVSLAQESGTRVYVGYRARLSAEIPAGWTVPADGRADYAGEDGFVYSSNVPGNDLREACAGAEQTWDWGDIRSRMEREKGEDACVLEGQVNGRVLQGVLLSRPASLSLYGETYSFVELLADPDHFDSIRASVSFDPADVTPRLYAESVLDIMEARAWYAPEVDWDRLRDDPLGLMENAESYSDVYWVIRQAIENLRAWGDNHSSFVSDMDELVSRSVTGTGMILQGRVVYLVYPDSSAGRAGIRVGDTIEAVDGDRFDGTRGIEGLIGFGARVTVSRSGVPEPFDVEVVPDPYDSYLPPNVQTLDGVGYVELFTTLGADPVRYATDANDGIAQMEERAICGWVVDLRRNGGGGYSPMTIGTAALLEDGELLSFVRRDGTVAGRVELREGSISQDGMEVAAYLGDVPHADHAAPGTPIAVLIGPGTGSAAEVTAVAYIGQPNTRLFGEKSGGYTIGNNGYMLFDGAQLALAESTYVDRNGNNHIGGIAPDVEVSTDLTTYGTVDDPVIAAASAWLRTQSGCEAASPVP